MVRHIPYVCLYVLLSTYVCLCVSYLSLSASFPQECEVTEEAPGSEDKRYDDDRVFPIRLNHLNRVVLMLTV